MIHCSKLLRESEGLDFAPWPGELGQRIYENVSAMSEFDAEQLAETDSIAGA